MWMMRKAQMHRKFLILKVAQPRDGASETNATSPSPPQVQASTMKKRHASVPKTNLRYLSVGKAQMKPTSHQVSPQLRLRNHPIHPHFFTSPSLPLASDSFVPFSSGSSSFFRSLVSRSFIVSASQTSDGHVT